MPQTERSTPLLGQLRYAEHLRPAMQQVFGRVMVCSSLEDAGRLARQHNLICVTPDGDQINKRGVLSGGYHDQKRSRLQLMKQIREGKEKVEQLRASSGKLKQIIADRDAAITALANNLHMTETQVQEAQDDLEQIHFEVRSCRRELLSLQESLSLSDRQLAHLSFDLRRSEDALALLSNELASPFLPELTPAERTELLQGTQTLSATQASLIQASHLRSEVLFLSSPPFF